MDTTRRPEENKNKNKRMSENRRELCADHQEPAASICIFTSLLSDLLLVLTLGDHP